MPTNETQTHLPHNTGDAPQEHEKGEVLGSLGGIAVGATVGIAAGPVGAVVGAVTGGLLGAGVVRALVDAAHNNHPDSSDEPAASGLAPDDNHRP